MSCTIPAIENRFRQSNPELANKLNDLTFNTWNTLIDSKLFEEKNNELYVNKEGTKKRANQEKLIGTINNPILDLEKSIVDGFLKDFNISVNEYQDLKKELNLNAVSASDLISKTIAYEKGTSILPEVAYFAYQILGKSNDKVRRDLRYLVNKWDKYKDRFKFHKNIVNKEQGFIDDKQEWKRKIRDLVILDFLQESLVEYYKNPKQFEKILDKKLTKDDFKDSSDFTLWESILHHIKETLSIFRNNHKDKINKLQNIGYNIANEILNKDYNLFNYELNKEAVIKTYDDSIKTDGFAEELVNFGTKYLKIVLTGSLALRKAGKVYRTLSETFHDIDWVIPFEKTKVEDSDVFNNIQNLISKIGKEEDIEKRINKELEKTQWYKAFSNKYSNFKIINGFFGREVVDWGSYTLQTVIDGDFNTSGEWIPGTGYVNDFFVRLNDHQEEHENYFKLWKEIMIAKIKMGRIKDFSDWKAFIPYYKSADKFNFYYKEFVHLQPKDIVQITEDNKISVDVLKSQPLEQSTLQKVDSKFSPAQLSDVLKPMYQKLLELNNNDEVKTQNELLFGPKVIFTKAYTNELGEDVGLYHLKSEEEPTFSSMNGSLEKSIEGLKKDLDILNKTTQELFQEIKNNRNITKAEILLNKLSQKFNIPWQWVTDTNEKGSIKDGVVYINKDLFTEDTLFHEFAHPFVEYLYQHNKTIYTILATNSSKVVNSNTGKTVKEEVKAKYSDYSQQDLEKEIITEAIGLAAIDKLTEENKTSFFNILAKFLKYISDMFGIDLTLSTPYKDIANMLFNDNYTQDLSQFIKGDYFQRNNEMTRDEIETKFNEYNTRFVLDEPTHKYKDTLTGEELDSVTTAIIKPLYKQLGWNNLSKNKKDQVNYAIQAAFGTIEHNLIQYLIENNLNSDKSIKNDLEVITLDDVKSLGLHIIDINQELDLENGKENYRVRDVLKNNTITQTINFVNNYLNHVKDVYPGAHIFTEQKIYDSNFKTKNGEIKLIGTADIVIVLPNGSYFINDWKSTSTQYGTQFGPVKKEALDNIKKQAYKEQLITYGKMIGGNFQGGVAYPIGANLTYDYQNGLSSPSTLEFPHPNPLKADPTNRILYPVVVSGKEEIVNTIDELVKNFKFLQNQIRNGKWKFNEDHSKYEQVKSIDRIIEDLETRKSLNTAIYEASLLMNEIRSLLNDMTLDQVENAQQQIDIYTQLSKYFRDFNLNDNDRNIAAGLQYNITELSKDLDIKRSEILKEKGIDNGISNLNTSEKKYGFLQRNFKGISTVTDVKTLSLFYRLASKVFNISDFNARKDLTNINNLENGLKEYGKKTNMNILKVYHKFLKKDKDGNPLPKLLQQVQDVYYETIAKALQESNVTILNSYLNLADYQKVLNEKVIKEKARLESIYENINFSEEQISNFRKKVSSEKDTDEQLQKQMRIDTVNSKILKFKNDRTLIKNGKVNPIAISNLFTISKDKTKAYAHTGIITYSDKIKDFYTTEYKEVVNNPELKAFYDFMITQNSKAVELGHIDFKQKYTFIPSVIASSLEKAERGDIGALKFESLRKQLENSYVDEHTASTTRVNEITGEKIYIIPKLYKNNLTTVKKDEKGNDIIDYSNYSLDLGGIYALYSMELHNYEAKSTLAPYGDALINLEKTKKNLVTNKFNNVVLDGNGLSQEQDLKANVKFVEDVILRDVYNITHATTNDLAIKIPIPVLKTDEDGKTSIVLEKRTLSGNKVLRGTIAFNSHTNLGLNFMSAAATFFGGSMNAYFESNRSSQFNKNDLKKSMKAVFSIFSKDLIGDKNLTLINLIDPMMENENLHRAVKLSSTKLRKIFNTSALYEMMRRADRAVQYGVTLSITNNYMIQNDILININEHIRKTYMLNGKSYNELLTEGNTDLINQARKEIKKLTEETKTKNSIYSISQIKGDNLDTPLTEDLAMQLRNIIRKQNAQIIGNMSQRDKIGAKNYILGGALMQYKNWMPSLLWQRFGNAEMDNDLGRLNWGKTRTFISAIHKDFFKILKSSFSDIDDISLGRIKTKYEELKAEFILNGGNENEFETLEDFTEYYLANFRSQLKELSALLAFMMLFSTLSSFLGWDDEDKKKSGYQKSTYKIYSKLQSELTFFYSPTQLSGIIKNVLPVTSTLENVEKLGTNLIKESFYRSRQSILNTDEHKHIEQITPTKYLFKMPILKEVTTWMALFDNDFRKEYNINIQHN